MDQLDLFQARDLAMPQKSSNDKVIIQNGEYYYCSRFFSLAESDNYFSKLQAEITWKQEGMNMYGKKINFPRLTAWYGDNNKPYTFSGITLKPLPWNEPLLCIKTKIESTADTTFNSVLLNLYRDGNDSISWHSDAEPELGKNPIIGSVNFGETRRFQLRHIITKEKIEIDLEHGSLLIMRGELQHYWQHQVPKVNKKIGARINLTFRSIH